MSSKEGKNKFLIDEDSIDMRLDNYLLKRIKDVPKSKIYKIIRKGEVRVNSKRIKPLYKLKNGTYIFEFSGEAMRESFFSSKLRSKLSMTR